MDAKTYRELGEAAWHWTQQQVRYTDERPWMPFVVDDSEPAIPSDELRDSIYFGLAGVALLLEELALARNLRDDELRLRERIATSIAQDARVQVLPCLYVGLAGDAAILHLLGRDDVAASALARLDAMRSDRGWVDISNGQPGVALYDLISGAAGIVLTGIWCGGDEGQVVARNAADHLLSVGYEVGDGLEWRMDEKEERLLPNYSHGTAGIAASLAIAGFAFRDQVLVDAATLGAARTVELADLRKGGLVVPHYVGHVSDEDEFSFSWCHGPTGTVHLFTALAQAGVTEVSGRGIDELRDRCLRSVLDSGVPARLRPGFWDNDGRCCGTAGVGDVLLNAAQADHQQSQESAEKYLSWAIRMGDALVDRAIVSDSGVYWRNLEHRKKDPLLPPYTGWSHGAAGIAGYLMRLARVLDHGLEAPAIDRPDQWWDIPAEIRTTSPARDWMREAPVAS